jgi:hypothetical protein
LGGTEAHQDERIRRRIERLSLSEEELRRNRSMGAETMKITVVGAILIVALVMAGILLLLALTENKSGLDGKQDDAPNELNFDNTGIGA